MCDHDELRTLAMAPQQREEPVEVEIVERRPDLVEDVEGARAREEDREQERERRHRLLATGEKRQALRRLPRGRDFDLDPERILGGALAPAALRLILRLVRALWLFALRIAIAGASLRICRRAPEQRARRLLVAYQPERAVAA